MRREELAILRFDPSSRVLASEPALSLRSPLRRVRGLIGWNTKPRVRRNVCASAAAPDDYTWRRRLQALLGPDPPCRESTPHRIDIIGAAMQPYVRREYV